MVIMLSAAKRVIRMTHSYFSLVSRHNSGLCSYI